MGGDIVGRELAELVGGNKVERGRSQPRGDWRARGRFAAEDLLRGHKDLADTPPPLRVAQQKVQFTYGHPARLPKADDDAGNGHAALGVARDVVVNADHRHLFRNGEALCTAGVDHVGRAPVRNGHDGGGLWKCPHPFPQLLGKVMKVIVFGEGGSPDSARRHRLAEGPQPLLGVKGRLRLVEVGPQFVHVPGGLEVPTREEVVRRETSDVAVVEPDSGNALTAL